jgi:hyperosmotically inducible periplasmic protein
LKYVSRLSLAMLFSTLIISSWTLVGAQNAAQQTPADNTKVNERDRNNAEPTADQQKNDSADRNIAQQIRQSVVKDKSLSTDAHNVKIISQNGMVTLTGPVRSEQEKSAIETKATAIAGADKVTSQLEVKPKN